MSNETLFYVCGGVLAVSAVILTFAGLKLKDFPGRAMPIIVLWFAIFVGGATTFAVLQAKDEEAAKAAELEHANEEIEEAEGEQEAEGAAEVPTEEEPVGPSEGAKGGAEAATTLQLAADPTALAFDQTELSAKPGKVTIDFDNPSAIPHNVVIQEDGKELAGFEPITESTESVSAELKAGTYSYICSVPGHAQAGMDGTLTVE